MIMGTRRPLRAALLLSASVAGMAASPAAAQIANLRGASGVPGIAVPRPTVPRPTGPLTPAQQTGSALAMANQARASAAYNLATQAQAAARASVTNIRGGITVRVPNGIAVGGLKPVTNPVLAANDPTGLNTWQGALKPTQKDDAGGKITVTVKQTESRAVLSWETFNVGADTTLKFDQKSNGVAQKNWVALNRVVGQINPATGLRDPNAAPAPSQILGKIVADGTVLVLNQAGVMFGNKAQVNTHSLAVSSLEIGRARALEGSTLRALKRSERNAEFLRYGLLGFSDQASPADRANAFAFSAMAVNGQDDDSAPEGALHVDIGARIESEDGGFLLFAGPKVVNEGTLTSNEGQVSLQSGRRIRITRSEGTATSADPNVRGLIVSSEALEGDAPDYVINSKNAIIESPRGYLSLGASAAGAVLQEGVLTSSTSVSRNGFVRLSGGDIRIGSDSLIWVKPDTGSETIPQSPGSVAGFKTSRIVIGDASSNIEFAKGSTLIAPSADVTIGAGAGASALVTSGGRGRIFIDDGALIDVGGVKDYVVPASRNVIKIDPVKGNELRDSPLYRATFLNGATVYVDPRLSGVRADGVRWVGSPLIEAESFYQQVGITASELMTSGGNVTLGVASFSGSNPLVAPDVIVKQGARIDISGGWVRYEGGRVQTSRLITASGQVVDIAAADPNGNYVGLVSGFTTTSERWGITQVSANPVLMGDRVEQAFTEGRDAGSLTIKGSAIAFDGTLDGQAYAGDRQIIGAATGSVRSSVFGAGRLLQGSPSDLPSGGFLYIQALGRSTVNASATTGGADIRVTGGVIPALGALAYGQTPTIDADGNLVLAARDPAALLDPARRDTILLSDDALSGSGLSQVSLETSGSLTVEKGAAVTLAPGGVFAGSAGRAIRIDGLVEARGGTIDLETFEITEGNVFTDDAIGAGSFDIVVGGILSTRGRWANDFGARSSLVGDAYLDGGNIRMAVAPRVSIADPASNRSSIDVSGSILIERSATIDVSGGGYVDTLGAIDTSARGGNLTLLNQTNYFQLSPTPSEGNETPGNVPGFRVTTNPSPSSAINPAEITSRVSIAGTILAHGFAGGGTFSLTTPRIAIGDGQATTGTELPLDFFSRTGFADYAITSFATALEANRFDNDLGGYNAVLETQRITIGAGETLRLTQTRFSPQIDPFQRADLQGLATGGDLYSVLSPVVPDTGFDRLGVGLTFAGLVELHVAASGSIRGDAGSSLGASKLWNEGDIRLIGGNILQRETLPALYADARGITSTGAAFSVRADGTIAEDDPNALGVRDENGRVLTNAELAVTPLYLLGDLGQGEGVRLSAGSVTDLSGASLRNPRSPQTPLGRPTPVLSGGIIAGGTIATAAYDATPTAPLTRPDFGESLFRSALISLDGITPGRLFTAEAGSTIDISGASDVFAQRMLGQLYVDRPVWSAGGALVLASGGTLTGATIRAGGGAALAEGGTLTMLDPVLSALPDDAAVNHISADAITRAGFDTFVALGSLTGSGDVTLALDRGFFLQSRAFDGDGGNLAALLPSVSADGALRIDAPYIRFDSLAQSMETPLVGRTGTGSVTFTADTMDVRGAVLFDRTIAQVNLASKGDIRLTGVQPTALALALPDTEVANSLLGQLVVNGDLALTAGRIYPTTGSRFLIASAGRDATIRFSGVDGANSGAPFSAGADLLVQAAHIDQDGVVRVPVGGLTLGGATALVGGNSPFVAGESGDQFAPATLSVTLRPGSVTSVSADGLSIPYGTTTDQIEYFFNPTGSTPLTALPEAVLRLAGQDIAIEDGASVDITGGGDVYAYEFIPGTGGSRDVLDRFNNDAFSTNDGFQYADGRQVYAIVPGLSTAGGAAYDPIYSADYEPLYAPGGVGRSVFLDGVPGLAPGWYTLLPAKYAMLPGGLRIVEQPETEAIGGATATLADGSVVTTGYFGTAGTGLRESTLRTFTVQSQEVFRQYSNIVLTSGTTTFADRAARNGVTAPRLPIDAGRLVLAPVRSLLLDAAIKSKPGKGGRGALADISGTAFRIASGETAPQDGVITLDATGLTNLAVESLLIGGTRERRADGTTGLLITADHITVANDATNPLSATEILLAVDGAASGIEIADGAAIVATGTPANPESGGYVIDGSAAGMTGKGAFVRVANGPERLVTRVSRDSGANTATLGVGGATLSGDAVVLDSSAQASLANASIDADAIALGAARISFGELASDGLVIGSALQSRLAAADRLTLAAPGTIAFSGGSYRFGDLVLDTPGIEGLGGDVVIRAGDVRIQNGGGSLAACAATSVCGTATLALTADSIRFAGGQVRQRGFDGGTRLVATDGILYQGVGGYDAGGGALAIDAPSILDAAVSVAGGTNTILPWLALASRGAVTITGTPGTGAGASGTPGAKLAINGDTVTIDGAHLRATAGVLSVDAANDIRVVNGARLETPGYQKRFGDAADGYVVSAGGGSLSLVSVAGDVVAGAGTRLSVGGGSGRAGLLTLVAQNGDVTLDGTIDAAAPKGGGSLAIDTGGSFDLGTLAAAPAGFTGAIDIRSGAGDLALGAGERLRAASLVLVADGGSVAIDGTIDTSGRIGGDVALYGRDGVALGGGALIDAHASGYAIGDSRQADAGDVILGTDEGGRIAVASGARIDLSATRPGDRLVRLSRNGVTYYSYVQGDRGGTLTLRAPIIEHDGADTADVAFAGEAIGARAITLEAFKRWHLGDVAQDDRFTGVTVTNGNAVLDVAASADGRANFLADVAAGTLPEFIQAFDVSGAYAQLGGLTASPVFAARPGVELVSDGAIRLASNWNLGAGTVDTEGAIQAGVMRPSDALDGRLVIVAGREAQLLRDFTTMLYRVGGDIEGQAGAFTIRAGGDLKVAGSISDGFFTFGNQSDTQYLGAVLGSSGASADPYYEVGSVGPYEFTDAYTSDSSNVFSRLIIDLGMLLGRDNGGGGGGSEPGPLPDDIPYDAAANGAAAIGNDPFGSAAMFPLIDGAPVQSSSLTLVAGAATDRLSVDPLRVSRGADATLSVSGERSYSYGGGGGGFSGDLTLNIGDRATDFADLLDTLQEIAPRDPFFGDGYDNAYTSLDFSSAPDVLQSYLSQQAAEFFAGRSDADFVGSSGAPSGVNTTGERAQAFLVSVRAGLAELIQDPTSGVGGGGGGDSPTGTATVRNFVRTGTGSIRIAASGSVDLRNGATPTYRALDGSAATASNGYQVGGSAIYTAGHLAQTTLRVAIDETTGVAHVVDPAEFLLGGTTADDFADFTYGTGAQTQLAGLFVAAPVYADGGGDISIDAGRDVLARRDLWQEVRIAEANVGFIGASDQPWRVGEVGMTTNLRVNPQLFTSGIGTLGGGSIAIRAGGDVRDLTLTALTSATTASATPVQGTATRALVTFGGGDVVVRAGGDLVGGRLDLGRGAATIEVAGNLVSGGTLGRRADDVAEENLFQLRLSDATAEIVAGGSIVMQGIAALGATRPAGEGSAAFNSAGFYSPRSAVSLVANASIDITNPRSTLTTVRGGGAIVAVYPATVEMASLAGDLALTRGGRPGLSAALIDMVPSTTGQLRLFAGGDILPVTIAMDDRDAGQLPGVFSSYSVDNQSQPLAGQDFGFPTVLPDTTTAGRAALHNAAITHADDEEPVRVQAGGDLKGLILSLPKQARIGAGRDITDMMLFVQNLAAGDITRVTAGRDIVATTRLTRALLPSPAGSFGAPLPALQGNSFVIGGPGTFMLEAGRDAGPFFNSANADPRRLEDGQIDFAGTLAFGGGILSIGNEWNPFLPEAGADVAVLFGVAKGADYDGLRDTYLDPANIGALDDDLFAQVPDANGNLVADRDAPIYADILIAWIAANTEIEPANYAQAYQAFLALDPLVQRRFLVNELYFNELEATSRPDGPSYLQYSRGYRAVNTLFPAALGYTENNLEGGASGASETIETGNLDLRIATIQTARGGSISILGPGGRILAGSTVRTAEQAARRSYDGARLFAGDRPVAFGSDGSPQIGFSQISPSTIDSIPTGLEGIITLRGGAIRSFTDADLLLNQSRLFTQAGGDITLWSSNGDLNAGQGPRSAANFPPVVVRIDENAFSQVDAVGGVSGAGIAAFTPAAGVTAPDVFLIAPRGTVDAGDAGVRVAGNLFVAAAAVANADNFQVGGTSFGVVSSPVVDAGAQAAANAASAAAQQVAEGAAQGNRRDDPLSRISVDVQGYAGAADDPCDDSGPRAPNCPTR
jgi:filamentous hemagglutinin family protein